ncbi:hypothetical protein [Kordiimonas sp.]|uniref:hypothetical protein n=1 Tax=Kordiimonas sp. TaxID=1970157 RepID=UPI003A8EEEE3
MGKQIIKQPDGRFAIWSSIVDDFVATDLESPDEIVGAFVEEYRQFISAEVVRVVDVTNRGGKPYHRFTKTFDDCVKTIREVHGSEW